MNRCVVQNVYIFTSILVTFYEGKTKNKIEYSIIERKFFDADLFDITTAVLPKANGHIKFMKEQFTL